MYEVNLGKDALQTDATLEQTQDGRNANKHRSKGSKQGRIHTQHKLQVRNKINEKCKLWKYLLRDGVKKLFF